MQSITTINESTSRRDLRRQLIVELPVRERYLELAGIRTALLEGGDGPTLILLHGPGEFAAKWLRVIPELARKYRLLMPDLPGHGASEANAVELDERRVTAWLAELIERTCPTPPLLVGQTMGGAIAAGFASEHPDRVRRLVLVDTLGLVPLQPAPEFGAALGAFLAHPCEATHDELWRWCSHDRDALVAGLGERWERLRAYALDRARAPSLAPPQRRLFELFAIPPIPPARLARISTPTVLIWGRHDLVTPLSVAREASTHLGWPLLVIDRAGDDPSMDQPAEFVRALEAAVIDTRAGWDLIAPAYDRTNTPTQQWIAEQGLQRAGLRPGMRLLDVAAGSGALSIPAARRGAEVVAVDQSAAMLDLLRARARREGLSIETRQMDGHILEFEDESFDVAGSQFGVMLFPDMPRAVRELARVVKPGGRVLVNAYGDPRQIEFIGLFVQAIRAVRPSFDGPPMDPPPLPFQLRDPARVSEVLIEAGLAEVKVESLIESTEFRGGEEVWDWIISSNPFVEELLDELRITEAERETIRHSLKEAVSQRAAYTGLVRLTDPVNIGVGLKPGSR